MYFMIINLGLVLFKSNQLNKGLNFNNYKIIVLKSLVHLIDEFQDFSKNFNNAKTNGLAICDLIKISYKNLNKNIETDL